MLPDEIRLKELKAKLQKALGGIFLDVVDSQNSVCHLLVKAYRAGLEEEKALQVFEALRRAVADCQETYDRAIAQPAPTIQVRERVVL